MSTLEKSNNLSASSDGLHDPALERASGSGRQDRVSGTGTDAETSPADDNGLHLQNAHFGALSVETQTAAPPTAGAAAKVAPGAEDKPLTTVVGESSHSNRARANDAPTGRFVEDGSSPALQAGPAPGDSTVVSAEKFSLATVNPAGPEESGPSTEALPQPLVAEESENGAPTDIELSNTSLAENAAGAVVGKLTTIDPDAGETFRYTVSDDRFEVVDGELKLKDGIALDHESEPSLTISVTVTDGAGHSFSETFMITVENVNERPSDITLSNLSVAENGNGAAVGTLATVDPDSGDTHTYTVSDDRFEVVGGQLKLKDGISLDHEAEPSVTVQVTATDADGLSHNETFTITVENVNEAPTDIALSHASVAENAAGAIIGNLTAADQDVGDSHTYTVSDSRFEVASGQLKLKDGIALDHEAEPSVTVEVTATDAGGLSYSESFTIAVDERERSADRHRAVECERCREYAWRGCRDDYDG